MVTNLKEDFFTGLTPPVTQDFPLLAGTVLAQLQENTLMSWNGTALKVATVSDPITGVLVATHLDTLPERVFVYTQGEFSQQALILYGGTITDVVRDSARANNIFIKEVRA